jgi:hypothetical protein
LPLSVRICSGMPCLPSASDRAWHTGRAVARSWRAQRWRTATLKPTRSRLELLINRSSPRPAQTPAANSSREMKARRTSAGIGESIGCHCDGSARLAADSGLDDGMRRRRLLTVISIRGHSARRGLDMYWNRDGRTDRSVRTRGRLRMSCRIAEVARMHAHAFGCTRPLTVLLVVVRVSWPLAALPPEPGLGVASSRQDGRRWICRWVLDQPCHYRRESLDTVRKHADVGHAGQLS